MTEKINGRDSAQTNVLWRFMTEIGKARDRAIRRIRDFFAERPALKFPTFARRAKIHRNTLYGFHCAGWNPTLETLEKCLQTIDDIEAEEARARKPRPSRSAVRAGADKLGEAA